MFYFYLPGDVKREMKKDDMIPFLFNENQFSLNGNGIMLSFLGRQFYRSTL